MGRKRGQKGWGRVGKRLGVIPNAVARSGGARTGKQVVIIGRDEKNDIQEVTSGD